MSQTIEAPTVIKTLRRACAACDDESTREMPRLKAAAAKRQAASPHGRNQPKPAPDSESPLPAAPAPRSEPASLHACSSQREAGSAAKTVCRDMKDKMIADAVRLLKWGKPWHELAELIGRIADRPPVPEIRKVLRANKADIESKAARPSDHGAVIRT